MALEHLLDALTHEHGVVIETNDPRRYRNECSKLRTAYVKQYPEIAAVEIVFSPTAPDREVWLINRSAHGTQEGSGASGEGNDQPLQG